MASHSQMAPPIRTGRVVALALVVPAVGLAWFARGALHYLFDWSVASFTPYYWGRRIGLVIHILPGIVASTVGLVQVWLGMTGRWGPVHRALGRVYVVAVGVGCAGGVYLALTIPGNFAYASGLFFLAVAWAVTTLMAVVTIRARMVAAHREWMLRSYTVTFGFVLFRLMDLALHGMITVPADPVADQIDIVSAWACWALPLLALDAVLQLRPLISGNRRSHR